MKTFEQKIDALVGTDLIKPIVLKQQKIILKILGQPFQGDWDAQAVYICNALAKIERMLTENASKKEANKQRKC